jgi:SAM-dependent methyltransferase
MDPKTRFSDRVENYRKYRPSYPAEVIDIVRSKLGLSSEHTIADVGAGTGISSKLFLENGNTVFGIEPNEAMLNAAISDLDDYDNFFPIKCSAEQIELTDDRVDFIVVGQALHWFDIEKVRKEFARILKPGGHIVILYNSWKRSSAFNQEYESLLFKYSTDYKSVNHKKKEETILDELFLGEFEIIKIDNIQVFDFEGIRGRLLSSSYVPTQEHPNYEPILKELKIKFDEHQVNGKISFEYDTEIIFKK